MIITLKGYTTPSGFFQKHGIFLDGENTFGNNSLEAVDKAIGASPRHRWGIRVTLRGKSPLWDSGTYPNLYSAVCAVRKVVTEFKTAKVHLTCNGHISYEAIEVKIEKSAL